ncbi:hypothetical protein [Halovivax cerinus]|uniref:Uncharacterized protein n=1 Tax=Halovivax cerinus TaxID=1487865 RepID=A0ABD5NM02_9EURY|nr:hypothetical protein [Halovivax cerinus]
MNAKGWIVDKWESQFSRKEPDWALILDALYRVKLSNESYFWGVSPKDISEEEELGEKLLESQINGFSKIVDREPGGTEVLLREMWEMGLIQPPDPNLVEMDSGYSKIIDEENSGNSSVWSLTSKGFNVAHDREKKVEEHKQNETLNFLTIALAAVGLLQGFALSLNVSSKSGEYAAIGVVIVAILMSVLLLISWKMGDL